MFNSFIKYHFYKKENDENNYKLFMCYMMFWKMLLCVTSFHGVTSFHVHHALLLHTSWRTYCCWITFGSSWWRMFRMFNHGLDRPYCWTLQGLDQVLIVHDYGGHDFRYKSYYVVSMIPCRVIIHSSWTISWIFSDASVSEAQC